MMTLMALVIVFIIGVAAGYYFEYRQSFEEKARMLADVEMCRREQQAEVQEHSSQWQTGPSVFRNEAKPPLDVSTLRF
jgi:hypothetical protein